MKTEMSVMELQNTCIDLKKHVIDMIWKAQSGHPGGSLSVADFVTACYFRYMNVDPANPRWADRDRFVLSKGHVCPAQYAALAMKGFFPMEVLDTLRKEGSPLQGHPSMNKCPGIDISTGSLGQGLACAVGMALAGKLDGKDYKVFSALGDGECNEGEIWEACGTAYKYKLDNLIVFVDWNNLQLAVMDRAVAAKNGLPKAIIGKTVKGKGVSFMENQVGWHGVAPNDEQYKQAMAELDAQYVR